MFPCRFGHLSHVHLGRDCRGRRDSRCSLLNNVKESTASTKQGLSKNLSGKSGDLR